jgi:SAM-dependent methyltransferase
VGGPREIVAEGYDQIADRYPIAESERRTPETYLHGFLDRCLELLGSGACVLDLGCGAGLICEEIARRARVVGVDISSTQLRLARRRLPAAAFVLADMTELAFRPASFDAVAAFWSVIHVPRDLHAELFGRIHGWLRPGGLLFGTFGSSDNPAEYEEFLGAPMYWSHFNAQTTQALIARAGFSIVQADVIEDRGERPLWLVATA